MCCTTFWGHGGGLWVSLSHPTIFGHRVDYTLGNSESKSIWTIPKFPYITILWRFSTKWEYQALRQPPSPLFTTHSFTHYPLLCHRCSRPTTPVSLSVIALHCRAAIIRCHAPSQPPPLSAAALHCRRLPSVDHHRRRPTPLSAAIFPAIIDRYRHCPTQLSTAATILGSCCHQGPLPSSTTGCILQLYIAFNKAMIMIPRCPVFWCGARMGGTLSNAY